MKKHITLTVLLISLLAVGAYAQAESEPVQDQSRQDGSENAVNPETGTANQNYTEYENAKPGEAHDPSGPAGTTGQGDVIQGDKALDGDKVGDCDGEQKQTQQRLHGDGDGTNHELGEGHRKGEDFIGEGGPHGLTGTGSDDGLLKIFGDDASGEFAGELIRHSWGPGTSDLEGHFGPHSGDAGFGPGGQDAIDGEVDAATSARGQARSGRR